MTIEGNNHIQYLRDAFIKGNLTLYLGAGVSKPNGLPSWEELVQALYFSTLEDESYIYNLRPFPNYLFALAEWVLKQKNEPLDIIIRKIKQWYEGKDFMGMLSNTLYAGFGREMVGEDIGGLPEEILNTNKTMVQNPLPALKGSGRLLPIITTICWSWDWRSIQLKRSVSSQYLNLINGFKPIKYLFTMCMVTFPIKAAT